MWRTGKDKINNLYSANVVPVHITHTPQSTEGRRSLQAFMFSSLYKVIGTEQTLNSYTVLTIPLITITH